MGNPVDEWAAIQQMKATEGWKILMERYAKEGDAILSMILDTGLEGGVEYTKRDLYVHQLEALGRLSQVVEDFRIEAESGDTAGKQPNHIGS